MAPLSETPPSSMDAEVPIEATTKNTDSTLSQDSDNHVVPSVEKDTSNLHLDIASRLESLRPKLGSRHSSGTIIISREQQDVVTPSGEYPPDDARAMSPRRNSAETEKLGEAARASVQEHAKVLQSGLIAIAEKIEDVKADHEKLEKENLALQDYIGGLTRSMSNIAIGSSKGKK